MIELISESLSVIELIFYLSSKYLQHEAIQIFANLNMFEILMYKCDLVNNNNILFRSITELNQLVKDILGVYLLVTTLTLCSVAVRLNTVRNNFDQ